MKDLFQKLRTKNITPNGYYLLYCMINNHFIDLPIAYKTEMSRLQLQGLLDDQFNLTGEAKVFMDECAKIELDKPKKVNVSIDDKFRENAEKYRMLFPPTKESIKAVRSSINDILPRMTWFFKMYPHFSWEHVLNGTAKYITSLGGDYRYCMTAAYFIKKDDLNKNTLSRLASFCEAELDEDEHVENPSTVGFNKLV